MPHIQQGGCWVSLLGQVQQEGNLDQEVGMHGFLSYGKPKNES